MVSITMNKLKFHCAVLNIWLARFENVGIYCFSSAILLAFIDWVAPVWSVYDMKNVSVCLKGFSKYRKMVFSSLEYLSWSFFDIEAVFLKLGAIIRLARVNCPWLIQKLGISVLIKTGPAAKCCHGYSTTGVILFQLQ